MCTKGLLLCTFGKGSEAMVQYSSARLSTESFLRAYEGLSADKQYVSAGQAYIIVDEKPVGSFEFWRPIMNQLGVPYPRLRLPYLVIYYVAALLELIYHVTGIEPYLTRLEVNLVSLNNYYNVHKAKTELGLDTNSDADYQAILADVRSKYGDQRYATKYLLINCALLLLMVSVLVGQLSYFGYFHLLHFASYSD